VTLACCAGQAQAGVWGMDPVLGFTADYATNPQLLTVPNTAQTNGAVLLDAPTSYTAENTKFSLLPSFRLADSKGYSSVTSDYAHLNARGEYDTERGVLTATVGAARDSSIFFNYLSDGTVGVRRDSGLADLSFDRALTEKLEFTGDASETRVRYGEAAGVGTLTDYKYLSVSPTLSWNTTSRDKYTVSANLGKYDSLDGATESRSANLQAGVVGQLSELWTLTATGGYSRALNSVSFTKPVLVFTPAGLRVEFLPANFKSAQNGTIYSVELDHQSPRLMVSAIASRQVQPTGFAFLSRQESEELKATYTVTPRWTVTGDLRQSKYANPQTGTVQNTTTIPYASIAANWLWTEQWTLSVTLSRVRESVQNSTFAEHSTEATLTLSRRLNHVRF
jgi:hypothetical protein